MDRMQNAVGTVVLMDASPKGVTDMQILFLTGSGLLMLLSAYAALLVVGVLFDLFGGD